MANRPEYCGGHTIVDGDEKLVERQALNIARIKCCTHRSLCPQPENQVEVVVKESRTVNALGQPLPPPNAATHWSLMREIFFLNKFANDNAEKERHLLGLASVSLNFVLSSKVQNKKCYFISIKKFRFPCIISSYLSGTTFPTGAIFDSSWIRVLISNNSSCRMGELTASPLAI
jgi:hypothetical protein